MSYVLPFVLFALGAAIGIKFADVDLAPVFGLAHRSAWTHGPLIVWLALWLLGRYEWLYWPLVGFLPAHAVHLLADMFPRNWKGGALIKFNPIRRQLAPVLSFAWLGWGCWLSAHHWLRITHNLWGWIQI
jgi:hypothetical protein